MLKPIRNIDTHDFEVPFNFYTYSLPKNRTVTVEEDLFNFLLERWPKSFSFDVETKKAVPQADRVKTKALIKTEEQKRMESSMVIESAKPVDTFRGADDTPPAGTTDKDGVEWYGEGIQIEGGQHGS